MRTAFLEGNKYKMVNVYPVRGPQLNNIVRVANKRHIKRLPRGPQLFLEGNQYKMANVWRSRRAIK